MSNLDAIQAPPAAIAPPPASKLKRHLLAAVFSALVPGAGQLYLGKRRKALAILVAFVMVSIGFWPLRLPRSYTNLLLLMWVLLPLSFYAVCEALLGRDVAPSGRVSRWWILVGIPIHYVGLNLVYTSLLFGSGFHTARNQGTSMQPTLADRERFVYDTAYYRSWPKSRGDIVVFKYRDSLFIKRIAAVAGDTVEGSGHAILLNGHPLLDNSDSGTFGPVTVGPGKYFVLGDNLDMSLDSRTPGFGLVDENTIVGKALYSYQITRAPLSRRLDGDR